MRKNNEKSSRVTKVMAANMASKFAYLSKVRAIRQPRVIQSHTQNFNITGNDGKGDVVIGINPSTSEVIKIVKLCPYPNINLENAKISGKEALTKVQQFLKERQLPSIPNGFRMEEPKLKTTGKKKHWDIVWRHFVDDVQVLSDFIYFKVSAETGEIESYSKVFHDIDEEIRANVRKPKLSQDQAIAKAKEILGKGTLKGYDPNMKVLRVILKIVYPNHFFRDWTYLWDDRQALAWIVQFGAEKDPLIDVWIDAFSGELLGGEIYAKPVPEMYGIPNQQGDITNIWKPALDLMQYNTIPHTIITDASETDVINSIANGEYFILQTHGGPTATAESATLNHDPLVSLEEKVLTPDEVPNNNLRYALVSCCYSGHDGSGQDFKDVFIDKGSDVFQGYYPSINPDPYEMALVRYLAEGYCLQNAHNLAVADTTPWFDIIIRWNDVCWNHIRLAPLRVEVNYSSTWHTAVITATVTNREDARHTKAKNVNAKLQMPAGFSIIAGANPQSTLTLNWLNSWTAQWIVHAPWWVHGTKTFDVIVWSNNLGVDVDDFDNPYHKTEIYFSLFPFPWWEYLQLVKWWKLALKRYPQLPEPKQIIKLSREMQVYKDPNDIRKKPKQFVKFMTNIAEQEQKFADYGLSLAKVGRLDYKAVEKYLEKLEQKTGYLRELQLKGIEDTNEILTMLSALQIQVNEAAIEAFL